ncbi:MAG: PilZ domain-containing protein [Chthonomonadales bacterium]|nr:PilZ domain-containing protein [Chthonomonadales bacterium]
MPLQLPPEDRRTALRQDAALPAVRIEHESDACEGLLIDISRTGVRLRAPHNLACGARIVISAPESAHLPPLAGEIVRRTVLNAAGRLEFEYGVLYEGPLDRARHVWFLAMRRAA